MHQIRLAKDHELRDALGVLVARPQTSAEELRRQVDVLTRYAARSALSLEHCLVAERSGRIVAACLCMDAPGRTANVFLPNHVSGPDVADLVVQMLCEHVRAAEGRGLRILQSMTAPDADTDRELLKRSGFRRLTELLYLERDARRPVAPASRPPPPVTWESYSPGNREAFARVVAGTYEGSRDCAELSGVRTIDDTLASHRATGEFDPRFWLLARNGEDVLGVLLLSRLPERASTEVVYMGLLPAARGRGYGVTLLRRALDAAREQGSTALTLTVDVENAPARRLYGAFGFVETARREVWMRILEGSR